MKYILLSLLTVISLETMFSGCIKTDLNCEGCVEKDTAKNQNDTTGNDTLLMGRDVAGPLRIAVRIGTPAGAFAGGATVMLAYTFDSVNMEKYFISKTTDSTGYVIFNDLPVNSSTKTRSYYANAYFNVGGEEMSSTNGNGSNGPVEIRLTKSLPSNYNIIVTYK